MLNIILFVTAYPILFLMYFFIVKNNGNENHLLFSVTMEDAWLQQEEVKKITSDFRRQMRVLLLILSIIPFTSLLSKHVSIQFTIWMMWVLALCFVLFIPFGIANKRLKQWKKENHLYIEQKLISYTELKNAGNIRKVTFLPFFLPILVSFSIWIFAIFCENKFSFMAKGDHWIVFTMACLTVLFWMIALLMDHKPIEVICYESDININYTRAKKNVWKNFWLLCSWINTVYTFAVSLPFILANIYQGIILVASIVYCVVIMLLLIPLLNKFNNIDKKYHDKFDTDIKMNDDNQWWMGIIYYNPKDNHTMVDKRVGVGTTINIATPLGKILTLISVIALLSLPITCIWVIMEEFTPIQLSIKDNTLCSQQIFEDYSIDVDDIENVTLVEELPRMSKSNGSAMDNLLKGKFHVRNQGTYQVFLNPQNKYFISFSADGVNYYMSGFDDEETMKVYKQLID